MQKGEFINYKTSMIADEDPLQGLLLYGLVMVSRVSKWVPPSCSLFVAYRFHIMYRQSPSGPVDPSFRALSRRLKFTVRRHKLYKDSLSLFYEDLGFSRAEDRVVKFTVTNQTPIQRRAVLRKDPKLFMVSFWLLNDCESLSLMDRPILMTRNTKACRAWA